MSDRPIPPVAGLQVLGKYLAAIFAGLPLGAVAGVLIMAAFGSDSTVGVVPVGSALLAMAAIGSYLGGRLEKMHSVAARWLLLLIVAVLPGGVLGAILFFSA